VSPGGGPRQHSHSAGPGSPLIPEPATASPAPPARLSRNDGALAGGLGRRSRSPSNTLTALAGGWPRSACPCLALHGSGEPDSAASLDATGREMAGPPRRVPDVRPVLAFHIKPGHGKISRCPRECRMPARRYWSQNDAAQRVAPCRSRSGPGGGREIVLAGRADVLSADGSRYGRRRPESPAPVPYPVSFGAARELAGAPAERRCSPEMPNPALTTAANHAAGSSGLRCCPPLA
jgi:hypothetical protein